MRAEKILSWEGKQQGDNGRGGKIRRNWKGEKISREWEREKTKR